MATVRSSKNQWIIIHHRSCIAGRFR
jgi:hypothetical protein